MQNQAHRGSVPPAQDGLAPWMAGVAAGLLRALGEEQPHGFAQAAARAFSQLPGIQGVRLFVAPCPRKPYLALAASLPAGEVPPEDLSLAELAGVAGRTMARPVWCECYAGADCGPLAAWRKRGLLPDAWEAVLLVVWSDAEAQPLAALVAGCQAEEAGLDTPAQARQLAALAAEGWRTWNGLRVRHGRQDQMAERLAQVTAACGLANAELSRAARLSDQFLANMSHELRTPLNTVLGMAQALQEGVMGPVTDDQMSYLLMIEKAGRQLLAMMTDILTLSKAGAGRLDVHLEMIAVQALCQDCLHFVIQPARQKHMKVDMQCDPAAPMLDADENILKQVLVNLLTNAVKFTPERGVITLAVAAEPAQHAVAFTVRDTGIGIAEADMERLFQPFVQLHDGLARQFSGTGLGLSLVYRLTDLHGGSISVTSTPDVGTAFTVRLPWTPPAAAGPLAELPRLDGCQVLLVDDNERTIAAAQDILTEAGARVLVARQGAEALERAAEERPDALVVDLQLSGMNGWALMQHLKANPRLHGLGIVGLSSLALPGERARCLAAGACDYLLLPHSPLSLRKAVANAWSAATPNHAQAQP